MDVIDITPKTILKALYIVGDAMIEEVKSNGTSEIRPATPEDLINIQFDEVYLLDEEDYSNDN